MRLLQIFEKYTSDNSALLRYMKNKPIDAWMYWGSYANQWMDSDQDIEDAVSAQYPDMTGEAFLYEPPHDLAPELWKSFEEYVRTEVMATEMQFDPAEAPTWAHMDLNKNQLLKPDTWLIHFSDNASDIAREGFTIGMDQMDRLGLTTYTANSSPDKSYGGYNFAFKADDRRSYFDASQGKYGSDMVMFQNSGVEADHHGDNEDQIMFIGKDVDPRGIILINNIDGDWTIMPHPLSGYETDREMEGVARSERLPDAIEWVKTNHAQYRKIITGY